LTSSRYHGKPGPTTGSAAAEIARVGWSLRRQRLFKDTKPVCDFLLVNTTNVGLQLRHTVSKLPHSSGQIIAFNWALSLFNALYQKLDYLGYIFAENVGLVQVV